ncbi:Long-chain-fatty-acid--CoA ligase [Ruegeria sp. THAF57]|uniref:AMP-binding protein n=1 Tax=Ruegeria sp. THAF57 TaxID=2744555 RepID=UPI0015DDEF6B|nr:AMP-binding protein [Ruegeria sp. THAF57]CAD0187215.1 Long-chain-fatty-acid--CoA ligase [Ruegeria sp. THAF57]
MTYRPTHAQEIEIPDLTITQRVFADLAQRPDDTVLIDGLTNASLSAASFIQAVKQLAGGLTSQGFGAGQTVALMAPNSPEYCIVFHAVGWAGGTITTINPTYTASEVHYQLMDSGADLLIADTACLDVAKEGSGGTGVRQIVTIGDAPDTPSLHSFQGAPLDQQAPVDLDNHNAVLPYSSGTTGLPKGVRLSHRNLVGNVDQSAIGFGLQRGEVIAGFLPFFHIYGMNVLMNMHLAHGGTLVTLPRFDLERVLKITQQHKSRRLWVVPPVALMLSQHPMVDDYDISSVELLMSGAAPMGPELSDAVEKRLNCTVLQGFGMTELGPVSHATPISGPRAGSSGILLPNTLCRIVDPETGEDMPAGQEGEMWIKGPQVMIGYLNNDAATRETLTSDGWLKTGDIAVVDQDGYMFIVDRLKELIKYNGFQVAPAELEATLLTHPGVQDAAVIGRPDPVAGELPVGFVVTNDANPSDDELMAHVAATLAHYKHIHHVIRVDEIPKSASGKILRRMLRQQLD